MVRGALVDMLVCERRNIHSHMHGMSSGLYRGGSVTDWCLQVCLRRVATKVWVEWGWAAGGRCLLQRCCIRKAILRHAEN